MRQTDPIEVQLVNGYLIALSRKQIAPFLTAKKPRVRVQASSAHAEIEFHAALQKREDLYYMMFSKAKQKELGLQTGEAFTIRLFEDQSQYGVIPCEAFEAVMQSDSEALELFDSLSSGAKRSLIYAINRYKSAQTQVDKALLLADNLKRGFRSPRELLKSS
ncbi:YdeI/OmpD-associated family protein [Croceiramulus getboli]|nr:YdeI/OmpD-associated family protein [Flavobacteriaceae bacterium YJPT1-3]